MSLRLVPHAVNPDILDYAAYHQVLSCNGSPRFTIAYFGKNFGTEREVNWTLPCVDAHAQRRMSSVLRVLGPNRYYAINASHCNAAEVAPHDLHNRITLDPDIHLFGNPNARGDVIRLIRGEGLVLLPAGCGIGGAELDDKANASHLSRRSLLCSGRIVGQGEGWRPVESVTDTLVRSLGPPGAERHIRIWLRCFIPPGRIPYSLIKEPWAAVNKRMLAYIKNRWGGTSVHECDDTYYIDLVTLTRLQLQERGVLPEHIDTTDATIQGDVWLEGKEGAPRNMQVLVRH